MGLEVNGGTARREIAIFLIITALLSAPFYFFLFTGRAWSAHLSHIFMYTPAVAALITTLIVHRRVHELGFRLGKPRHYAVGYVVPLLFCVPVYLLTWALGLGAFDSARLDSIESSYHLPHGAAGIVTIIVLVIVTAPLGMLNTFGEELGWSGLLTHRLMTITTFTRASLIRGVIWSLWHYPLVIVLLPRYRPGLPVAYGLACMTVAVTSISFVYTWLRMASGSVWPAALLHAASANFQDIFEHLTKNTGPTPYITYEYGAGFAVILPLVALYFHSLAPVPRDPEAVEPAPLVVPANPDGPEPRRINPRPLD